MLQLKSQDLINKCQGEINLTEDTLLTSYEIKLITSLPNVETF